jgi:hypothetical protein
MVHVKTKDNCQSGNGQKKKGLRMMCGNGQKQSQGNLKTVKLTEKQSYGTSHGILKTVKIRHGKAENWENV